MTVLLFSFAAYLAAVGRLHLYVDLFRAGKGSTGTGPLDALGGLRGALENLTGRTPEDLTGRSREPLQIRIEQARGGEPSGNEESELDALRRRR